VTRTMLKQLIRAIEKVKTMISAHFKCHNSVYLDEFLQIYFSLILKQVKLISVPGTNQH